MSVKPTQRQWITIGVLAIAVFVGILISRENVSAPAPETKALPTPKSPLIDPSNTTSGAIESSVTEIFDDQALSLAGSQVDAPNISRDADGWKIDHTLRYYYEYFLTLQGEMPLKAIKELVKTDLNQRYEKPLAYYLYGLFERYLQYRTDIDEELVSNDDASDWTLAEIRQREHYLQEKHFSDREITALFDESYMDEYADENTQQGAYDNYQQFLQENPDIDPTAIRTELFGVEAAIRLKALDERRNRWKKRSESFICEKIRINQAEGLTDGDKKQHIDSLKKQLFNTHEALRIDALENNQMIDTSDCQK
ncbi:Lipase chaperone [BD1-7 clade bacterium]|uniref:Lipase chaperone n=1 Tax=BD1-7 clade bacterium TaxID=2029982 RepID=A0A5S9NV04_9GAMM|nr:Lipase chaperone [BD1-7 clade bacterium]CAA0109886.1 Lipase chaperone [BD1-7 clade bacterium]